MAVVIRMEACDVGFRDENDQRLMVVFDKQSGVQVEIPFTPQGRRHIGNALLEDDLSKVNRARPILVPEVHLG